MNFLDFADGAGADILDLPMLAKDDRQFGRHRRDLISIMAAQWYAQLLRAAY